MIVFKLDKILNKKKITRYKFQQYTDLSPRRINEYYNGEVQYIKVEELDLFCKILDCKITDIVDYTK